jgi:hypothetical protein
LSRDGESTRCRDATVGIAVAVATRARWRVESVSSEKKLRLEKDGEGVMGKTGEAGTRTGKVVVVLLED